MTVPPPVVAPPPVVVPPPPPSGLFLLAGPLGGKGNIDGPVGRFQSPSDVKIAPSGVLYVPDFGKLRTVTPGAAGADSQVATIANPTYQAVAPVFDAAGNRYTAETSYISKVTPAGERSILAGGDFQSGNVDGTGAAARFSWVRAIAIDAGGNLYASDVENQNLRKITPAGVVTTLATVPGRAESITLDDAGNIYVPIGNAVHRYTPSGEGSVLLPASEQVGPETIHGIAGIAVDKDRNVYVAEDFGCSVRKISAAGVLSNFAGKSDAPGSTDGAGDQARFCEHFADGLRGLTIDAAGNLYVADKGNATIRKITPDGTVSTIAGKANLTGHVDGVGTAARFAPQHTSHISVDAQGNVFVGEGPRVRKVGLDGRVSTLALPASASGGAVVSYATGELATGGAAVAFSEGVLSRVDANGNFTFLAGQRGVYGNADGTGAQATFRTADKMIMDGQGNLYVIDSVQVLSGNMWISSPVYRKITPGGVVTTLRYLEQMAVHQWAADKDGALIVASQRFEPVGNRALPYEITRVAADGTMTVLLSTSAGEERGWPSAVAVDRQGNVFVGEGGLIGDKYSYRIRRIASSGSSTLIAGQVGELGVRLGALPASLGVVASLAVGADGTLYLMSENSVLRLVL